MPRIALFAGSFDPITDGHIDVVRQAAHVAETLVLAIGTHPGKTPLFTVAERLAMLEETCAPIARTAGTALRCTTFSGLVIDAARAEGATLMIRGLREGTDFDYEMQMAGMNGIMAPEIQTIFLPASPRVRPISSTLVRQISAMGGDVSRFVPATIAARLQAKYAGKAGS